MADCYLPLTGSLSNPTVVEKTVEKEMTKEELEDRLLGEAASSDSLSQNDKIAIVTEDQEDGHRSFSKIISADTLIDAAVKKVEHEEADFSKWTETDSIASSDEFLVSPEKNPLTRSGESENRKINAQNLASSLQGMMDFSDLKADTDFESLQEATAVSKEDSFLVNTAEGNKKATAETVAEGIRPLLNIPEEMEVNAKQVLSDGIDAAQNATTLKNEMELPVKKAGSDVTKARLDDLTAFLQSAPICKKVFSNLYGSKYPLKDSTVEMTTVPYDSDLGGRYSHVLIICGVKFKASTGLTYEDIASSDVVPFGSGGYMFYHADLNMGFGRIQLYFRIHGDHLDYRVDKVELDGSTNSEYLGVYIREIWGVSLTTRDSSGGGTGDGGIHLGTLPSVTNFAKEDMFLVEDTTGSQYSVTGEALASRLKNFMNLEDSVEISSGVTAFFSVNSLSDIFGSPEPYAISKTAVIGARPSVGDDVFYPCVVKIVGESEDAFKLYYGMFKITEETETEYKIVMGNITQVLLNTDVSEGSMLFASLDVLPVKNEEKHFTPYAFLGRWPETNQSDATRSGFLLVEGVLYTVEYLITLVDGTDITVKFMTDPVRVSGSEGSASSPGICAFLDVEQESDMSQGSYVVRDKKNIIGAVPEVGSLDPWPCIVRLISGDDSQDRFFWNWFYIPSETTEGKYVVTFSSDPVEFSMKSGIDDVPLPVLPGYNMLHKKGTVAITAGAQKVKIADLSELGLLEEDVAFCYATLNDHIEPSVSGWNGSAIIKQNTIWFIGTASASSNFTCNVDYTVVYRTETSLPEATLPNIYDTTSIPAATVTSMALTDKMLLGTPEGNKTFTQNDLVEFLKGQGLGSVDGEVLLPGVAVKTADVTVNFSAGTAITSETLEELFGISQNDLIALNGQPFSNGSPAIDSAVLDSQNRIVLLNRESYTVNNCVIRISAMYKSQIPAGGSPGLRAISKTKTIEIIAVSGYIGKSGKFGTLSDDFGISDPSKIVTITSYGSSYSDVCYLSDKDGIYVLFPHASTQESMSVTVTVFLQDESSDNQNTESVKGIRELRLTKTVVHNANGGINFADLSEFEEGLTASEVISVDVVEADRYLIPVIPKDSSLVQVWFVSSTTVDNVSATATISLLVKDIDVENVVVSDLPQVTELAQNDNFLVQPDQGANSRMIFSDLVTALKGQDLIDLDGKGRPLLPGYGIVTKECELTFQGLSYADFGFGLEAFGVEKENIVQILFYSRDDNYILHPYIHTSGNFYAVDFRGTTPLSITIHGVLGLLYKLPVPYEPGLKPVSVTKTNLTIGSTKDVLFGIIEDDFGIMDISQVVSVDVTNNYIENNSGAIILPSIIQHKNNPKAHLLYLYSPGGAFTLASITVTLLVKDYSSIGPEIVTEGIRMITKQISFVGSGTRNVTLANVADYDVTADQIVGIQFVSQSENNQNPKVYLDTTTGKIIASFEANTAGSGLCNLSLFVKVPVVEQKLKPFVKDVTVNLQGTAGSMTGIVLDGSDDVGGYTVDDVGSITATAITPGKWISPPAITGSNEIAIVKQPDSTNGSCVVRIKIDPK